MQQIAKVVMHHWHLMPLPLRVPVRLSPYANSLRPSPVAPFSRDKDIARLIISCCLSRPDFKCCQGNHQGTNEPIKRQSVSEIQCQAFLMCQLLLQGQLGTVSDAGSAILTLNTAVVFAYYFKCKSRHCLPGPHDIWGTSSHQETPSSDCA